MTQEDFTSWRVARIDIRSPVARNAWPVARLELEHPTRGRVTDIGTAPGAFDAAFAAASQITGVTGRLLTYDVRSAAHNRDGSLRITVEVRLEIDGEIYVGQSPGLDLVRCSVEAWLQAACRSHRVDEFGEPPKTRNFHVIGIDENDDLWIFASADEGAAETIANEFESDGYSQVRLIRGGEQSADT